MTDRSIVFYDGHCGFCDWSVQWVMKHDRHQRFVFAPLQGETAEAHGVTLNPTDQTLVVLGPGGELQTHSSAVLAILRELPAPWSWGRLLAWVPRALRDPAYRLFSRHRFRFFGRLETCRVPTPEERSRLLP